MANIKIMPPVTAEEKIAMMEDDARFEIATDYDAEACAAERDALEAASQVKGRLSPPKIPKMFVAGSCMFNCAYCGCRSSREGERCSYVNEPKALAGVACDMAKKNGHGVFISSAICKNPDYTQELIAETVKLMREKEGYHGFIHAKVMPGADPRLIGRTGLYADRLSVNIEVARSEGYARIAKQKTRSTILEPMGSIAAQIAEAKSGGEKFARTQTTQLMAGSTGEDDRTIMTLSQALYRKYSLRRVYYTAFRYIHDAKGYDSLPHIVTPRWRMARLYQADRLMQLYGFTPDDVTPADAPLLEEDIDPKTAWALRRPEFYPVELNTADYETLIRVPGIGVTYAKKIIAARRYSKITHDLLKQMKIPQKRCKYFIMCSGKFEADVPPDDATSLRSILSAPGDIPSIADSLSESRLLEQLSAAMS